MLSVSDWYHDQMPGLLAGFIAKSNPTGAEPVPQAVLLNDTQSIDMPIDAGKTYLVRVVNVGAFAGQYLWFEGHNMTVVEVDGVYTQPQTTSMLYLTAAQRCSFLLVGRNDTNATNYALVASMDIVRVARWTYDCPRILLIVANPKTMFDTLPPDLNYNATGWLVYDVREPRKPATLIDTYDPLDDAAALAPFDDMPLLAADVGNHDVVFVELNVSMQNRMDGANYAFFNDITYRHPRVPTVYTALSAPEALYNDSRIYGAYTHTTVVPRRGMTVQLVVNNLDVGRHPFHLHGHNFQIAYRSPADGGTYNDSFSSALLERPVRRDSVLVYPNGFVVLRFRADNPGVWLFHCHIEWHLASGLVATFVEAPADLRRQYAQTPLPADHLAACAAGGVPTTGNAAGNPADFLDLAGEDMPPAALPDGSVFRSSLYFASNPANHPDSPHAALWPSSSAVSAASPASLSCHGMVWQTAEAVTPMQKPPQSAKASPQSHPNNCSNNSSQYMAPKEPHRPRKRGYEHSSWP